LNKPDFNIKRRWDDDVVFKNQARGTEDKGKKKEFINVSFPRRDALMELMLTIFEGYVAFRLPQEVHGQVCPLGEESGHERDDKIPGGLGRMANAAFFPISMLTNHGTVEACLPRWPGPMTIIYILPED
jgi:hypothetical protein